MSQRSENTPAELSLIWAAEQGDHIWVDALIDQGMDVNSRNDSGMTALMGAAANGHHEVVKHLLELGADLGAKRLDGLDALALVFFGHAQVVKVLMANGADPTAKTRFGTTLDSWATARGFPEVAQILRNADSAQTLTVAASASEQISEPGKDSTTVEYTFNNAPRDWTSTAEIVESNPLMRVLVYMTSDWQRLTLLTLTLMLGWGLATFAFLKMESYEHEVTPSKLPVTSNSTPSNSQSELESTPPSEKPQSTRFSSEPFREQPEPGRTLESTIGKQTHLETNHWGEIGSTVPVTKSKGETVVEVSDAIAQEAKPTLTSENQQASDSLSGSKSATDLAGDMRENAVGSDVGLESPHSPVKGNPEAQRPRRVPAAPAPVPVSTPPKKPKSEVIQWP